MPSAPSDTRTPRGHLTDDGAVLVPTQRDGDRLYNKGYAGTPQKGGGLRLSLVEAARLVEEDRLVVTRSADDDDTLSFRAILDHAVAADPGAIIPLLAYRDLRARGYVVRHANKRTLDFLVWERGRAPPREKPVWLAAAVSERAAVTAAFLRTALDEADAEDATLVLLLVDEEGDLTHYRVTRADPRGDAPPVAIEEPAAGVFVRDRVLVWDRAAAERLHEPHFLGRVVPGGLQLSLVEANALARQGLLDVQGLDDASHQVEADLDLRTTVYEALRARGLWVKTGFKFGTHFRAYAAHPSGTHAPWLVHAVAHTWQATWPEVSRAVRLAAGVRKHLLLAITTQAGVELVQVERIRP